MKSRIHVNQHHIRANAKDGGDRPVVSIKTGRGNTVAHECEIRDEAGRVVATVVYRPDRPLACGARLWIETDLEVTPR